MCAPTAVRVPTHWWSELHSFGRRVYARVKEFDWLTQTIASRGNFHFLHGLLDFGLPLMSSSLRVLRTRPTSSLSTIFRQKRQLQHLGMANFDKLCNNTTNNANASRGYDNRSPEQQDKQRAHYAWIHDVGRIFQRETDAHST